jgi:menaquinone-9 beta-reductase
MKPARPIEIVGGGLAGLSLGLALRRHAIPVTLFEAGAYPRHRVCGEFITGLGEETITRLGLAPFLKTALPHREVAWFIANRLTQIQSLPHAALGLSRHQLDAQLAEAFVASGGTLKTQTRITETVDPAGRLFASGRRRGHSDWLGLKIHAYDLPLERDLELHLGDHCYVGLTRVDNTGCVNICGLFRGQKISAARGELLLAYLRASGLDILAGRIADATLDPNSFCAVAAVEFDRQVTPSGRMQLGDACAMIPPFTGNGMAMAFQSAECALDPILAYARGETDWDTAGDVLHTALQRRFHRRLSSANLLHPFLTRSTPQRLLSVLSRARLLPLQPLYAVLH